MPKFKFKQEHILGQNEAKHRISNLTVELKKEFADMISQVRESWNENHANFSFRMLGGEIRGDVLVQEDHAILEVKYPLILSPFKNQVEAAIRTKAKELLT